MNNRKRIYYSTEGDTTNKICGYVLAAETEDAYLISYDQYRNTLKNRTLDGEEVKFHTGDKEMRIKESFKIVGE